MAPPGAARAVDGCAAAVSVHAALEFIMVGIARLILFKGAAE